MRLNIHFDSKVEADAAAIELKSLGSGAVKLLSQCVETQGLKRKCISKSAESLERCGFIFIRGTQVFDGDHVEFSPSLAGEEALDALERKN